MIRPAYKTVSISPLEIILIPHRVGHVAAAPDNTVLIAYHPDYTTISLFTADRQRKVAELNKATGSLCMCASADGQYLTYASEGDSKLVVDSLTSETIDLVVHRSEIVDVRFDDIGRLWSVRRESECFVVEVRCSMIWDVISQESISDSYYAQGGAEIRPGQAGNTMFIGVYSGQSEQENYLCTLDCGILSAQHISEMDGEQFVFANPKRLITLDHWNCQVARFADSGICTSKIIWPDYSEDRAEDERPGYYGCYLDDDYFLAGSSEGRLFLLGLDPLRVALEIVVKGFEPVPVVQKYPSLSDIEGMGSDLRYLERCGGDIYFFFAESHQSTEQQLAIVSVCDLLRLTKERYYKVSS